MQTQEFLTYSQAYVIGQIADTSLRQIDSYVAEGKIEFGAPVIRGTDKARQVKQTNSKTEFLGLFNCYCKPT